ncbi:hypothetical protein ACHAWF_014641 [Thalassiosira exigua]
MAMDYQSVDPRDERWLTELLNFTASDFVPEPYVVPGAISSTHNQPRFGFTNDFDVFIEGNQQQVKEYVLGVIIGAMIILILALLWFFAIVCLKIAGPSKVGFLAGRLVRPAADQHKENEETGGVEAVLAGEEATPVDTPTNAAGHDHVDKFTRRTWIVRGIFVLSGILVIISGGLFYGKGVVSFKNSLDEVRAGIDLVQDAANKAIRLTDFVIQDGEEVYQEAETYKQQSETGGEICGLDGETSEKIRMAFDGMLAGIDKLKTLIDESLADFKRDLNQLISVTQDIDNNLDSADIVFYILIAISILLIGLIMAMIVGVYFACRGISNGFTKCIQYAIIWPMHIFLLLLSWILATLFLILSLAGADFCVSPDQHVKALLDKNEDLFEGIIFGFIIFYVSGCTIPPPGQEEIAELIGQMRLVMTFLHELTELTGELSAASIAAICGLSNAEANAVKALISIAHEAIHVINRAVVGLREVLSCETFNPIYTTFVHQAFCVTGVSGLTYIFATTLVISVFSMVMIMFRAALYPSVEPGVQPAQICEEDAAEEVVKYESNNQPGEGNDEHERENVGPVIY